MFSRKISSEEEEEEEEEEESSDTEEEMGSHQKKFLQMSEIIDKSSLCTHSENMNHICQMSVGNEENIRVCSTFHNFMFLSMGNQVWIVDFLGEVLISKKFDKIDHLKKIICIGKTVSGVYEFVASIRRNTDSEMMNSTGSHGGVSLFRLYEVDGLKNIEFKILSTSSYFPPISLHLISSYFILSGCYPYYDDDKYVEVIDIQSREDISCVRYEITDGVDDETNFDIISLGYFSKEKKILVLFNQLTTENKSELIYYPFDEKKKFQENLCIYTCYRGFQIRRTPTVFCFGEPIPGSMVLPFSATANQEDLVVVEKDDMSIVVIIDKDRGHPYLINLEEKTILKKFGMLENIQDVTLISDFIFCFTKWRRDEDLEIRYSFLIVDLNPRNDIHVVECEIKTLISYDSAREKLNFSINHGIIPSFEEQEIEKEEDGNIDQIKNLKVHLWSRRLGDDLSIERYKFMNSNDFLDLFGDSILKIFLGLNEDDAIKTPKCFII